MGKKSEKFITDIGKLVSDIKDFFEEWLDAGLKNDKHEEAYKKALHDDWDAAEKSLTEYLAKNNQEKWREYKVSSFDKQDKFRGSWGPHKQVQAKLDKFREAKQVQRALKKGARESILAKRKVLETKLKEFKTFLDKKVNWFGKTTKKTSVTYHKEVTSWLSTEVFS